MSQHSVSSDDRVEISEEQDVQRSEAATIDRVSPEDVGALPRVQAPPVTGSGRDQAAKVVRRARRATSAFFLLLGIAMASWAALVPFAKSRLGLDEASLGAILLAFGGGTIVSTLAATQLIGRFGSRSALVMAGTGLGLFVPALALAPSPVGLAVLLFFFGIFTGIAGVSGNAQAIDVQTKSGRPVMSSMHALFSIGGLVGATSSSLLLQLGLPIEWCAVIVSAVLLTLVATQRHNLLAQAVERAPPTRRTSIPPTAVLMVGLMTLSLYLAEGVVLDWGAVYLHDYRSYSISAAALGYAAFSVAMAISRLLGDRIVARLGPKVVVRFGSLVAAAGFAILVLAPGMLSGLVGCALIGIGASNVVPTLISASARVSDIPTEAAVSTVVAMGTCGLIAGPALIGFIAQATSLPVALAGPILLLLAVAASATVVEARGRTK